MLSNEDFVSSTIPAPVSNEELVALNPMYQHLIDNDPDAYYPWTSNLDEIAAEEEEIPIPCGYTNALYAMTATTDEQLNDYYALLDAHHSGICCCCSHHGLHAYRGHQSVHQYAYELGWHPRN